MIDRDRLDGLLGEVATAPPHDRPEPEVLRELARAFAEDDEFAKRGAAVLLTARALDSRPADEAALHFAPPPARPRPRVLLLPTAALLLGIILGRVWSTDASAPPPRGPGEVAPVRVEIARPIAERRGPDSALAYRAHSYENGFLAGKTLRVETGPR